MINNEKLSNLKKYIRSLGSIAVAFSGGVDSTFLLKVAHEELGEKAIAITALSSTFPKRESDEADSFCKDNGIKQITFISNEMSIPEFRENDVNRCYFCKKELFTKILMLAKENGIENVCEGSNMDDNKDYRPGMKAVEELGIKSPLRECNLYKEEIRSLSEQMGLPTWNKPSFACLASRFAYGEEINIKKMSMVEKAEQALIDIGFRQLRVRIHGDNLARIEVMPSELQRLLSLRETVIKKLRDAGFTYVTMDLQGYRTGAMNEVIKLV
ncbi:MAG: ATP-dependent sacrificial sulfur transferase LarE [Treponema sp.]|nr:ATP-dependent sacrificial sulfur transferase LarE [Treponema sp.]